MSLPSEPPDSRFGELYDIVNLNYADSERRYLTACIENGLTPSYVERDGKRGCIHWGRQHLFMIVLLLVSIYYTHWNELTIIYRPLLIRFSYRSATLLNLIRLFLHIEMKRRNNW